MDRERERARVRLLWVVLAIPPLMGWLGVNTWLVGHAPGWLALLSILGATGCACGLVLVVNSARRVLRR